MVNQQDTGVAATPPLSHPFGAEPVPVSGKAGIANAGRAAVERLANTQIQMTLREWGDLSFDLLAAAQLAEDAVASLEWLVSVIDKAGLHNLANGVQLGQTSWLVKASDAREHALAVIAKAEAKS